MSNLRILSRPSRVALLAGVMVLALIASACTRPNTPSPTPRTAPAVAVTGAAVQRGDIEQSLAYSGDLRSPNQVTVLAKSTGRIERLLVDTGSRVRAGDPIAELEQETATVQMIQARAGLAAAESKLAQIRAGGRADDVASAQAALSQQQVRLDSMRAGGPANDVALAQAALQAQIARLNLMEEGGRPEAISQAESALESARAKLTLVRRGATADVIQAAQSAVDSDVAALASAEAGLASSRGSSAADLSQAQNLVESLRQQVVAAEAALEAFGTSNAAEVQAAQSAYDAAVAALNSARVAMDQSNRPTDAQVAQAVAAVAQAEAQLESARSQRVGLQGGSAPGPCQKKTDGARLDSSGCSAATEAAADAVIAAERGLTSAQAQLAQLRAGGGAANQAQLQAAVDQADANVRSAAARLEAVRTGGSARQRLEIESQLVTARGNLLSAESRLASVTGGSIEAQRQAAESNVTAARERLRSDQARLDQILAGAQDEEIQQAELAVQQAEQQLLIATSPVTEQEIRTQRAAVDQARLQVEKALQPFTSFDVRQQEQAVAQAQANLRSRQRPYSAEDMQAAEAAVEEARAQVELARLGIRETRVTAPIDGIVSERVAAPGALVGPTSPIVTLVPPELELVVNVEEAQLGLIREGQVVSLQVASYPGQPFPGAVRTIAPTLDTRSRTAAVRISPSDPEGLLRAGMFARLQILTATRQAALLVPREAVIATQGSPDATVVRVDEESRARRVPVRTGLTGERMVEILTGLSEGQVVVTSGVANLNDGDLVAPQLAAPTAR
jgi:RND family efflux transporter MFP subunit